MTELKGGINLEWDRLLYEKEGNSRAALIMHCQALITQHQELTVVVLQQYQAVLKKQEEDQEFI